MTKQQIEAILKDPTLFQPEQDTFREDCTAIAEAASGLIPKEKGTERTEYIKRWCNAWRALERAFPLGRGAICIAARKLCKEESRPVPVNAEEVPRDVMDFLYNGIKKVFAEADLLSIPSLESDTSYAKLEAIK